MHHVHAVSRVALAVAGAVGSMQLAVAQVPFGPLLLAAGQNPAWVAAGDVNGDGRVDLVATNSGAGTISVFFANAVDGFASAITLPAIAGSPAFVDVELADIDKDTRMDIVAACGGGTSAVAVYRNLGSGTFATPVTIQVGASCSALAIGDLNGDTWPDATISNAVNPSTVKVLLNNGAGVLQAPSTIALAANAMPADLELANVDGDSDLDIVTTSAAKIAVLLNQGNATFAAPQLYPTPASVAVLRLGDWNNDNAIDLAVAYTNGSVGRMLNNGLGAFGASSSVMPNGSNVNDVAVGDLDLDGKLDIASSTFSNQVRVCLGLGGGAFGPVTNFYSGGHFGLVIHDVDGDGKPDVVVAREQDDEIAVLSGDGHGNVGNGVPHTLATDSFAWGDFNEDGLLDVAGPRNSASSMAVRLALAGGGFGPETLFPDGSASSRVASGFIDGDAHLDLLTQGADALVRVLPGDGAGGFGAPVTASPLTVTSKMVLGDMTGDGLADIAYAYSYVDMFGVLQVGSVMSYGDGAGNFAYLATENFPASSMVIADFDEDGVGDVALSGNGSVVMRLSYGGGLSGPAYTPARDMAGMVAADIDGDTHLDLIGATGFYGIGVQLGDGLGNLGAQTLYGSVLSGGPYTNDIAAADFDGDGDIDVVAGQDDTLGYFEGHGTGALDYRGTVLFGGNFLRSLAVADGDADGRIDVLAGNIASVTSGSVHVVHNHGSSDHPSVYCTAKTTSNGCVPSISSSGISSATATSGFTIACSNAINGKNGLLFYSLTGRAQLPFQSGTMCVRAPRQRTPLLNSGGNPPPDDCSGSFSLDLNAFAHGLAGGSPSSALTSPGTAVTAQWWGRDPLSAPNPTMLSNAIDWIVGP